MVVFDARKVLVAVGCAATWGCGSEGFEESPTTDAEAMTFATCANATRDVVLNSGASQRDGANTPSTYDNAGCDNGYVVEFDGTVNGVHYGYRPNTPQNADQGITVSFPLLAVTGTTDHTICDGAIGTAYLYEKQSNGTWQVVWSRNESAEVRDIYGIVFGCQIPTMVFSNPPVVKGTASSPHIYRVAVSAVVVSRNADFMRRYPDGVGYGPIHIYGAD
jgi:hypothetical protein